MNILNTLPPSYYPPPASEIDAFPAHLERTQSRVSTILPDYTSGVSITPNKTNVINMVTIVLDSPQTSYDIGDIVHGSIVFKPRKRIDVTSVGIYLMGEEVTMKSSWTSDRFVKRSFKIGHHIVPEETLPENNICEPGFTYSFPFNMVIPDLIPSTESSCCKEGVPLHYRLPPSLGTPPELSEGVLDVPNRAARITYSLVASVRVPMTKGRTSPFLSQYVKYIRICPSYTPYCQLLQSSQNPPSYKSSSQSAVRKNLLKRTTSGNLFASILETPILSLCDNSPPTSLSIKVSYCPVSKSSLLPPPPKIRKVSMNIIAETIYSTYNSMHLKMSAEDKANLQTATQKISTLQVSPYQYQNLWNLDDESQNSYFTQFLIPLKLSEISQWLPPTFESCFISRRYKIEVTITTSSNGSSPITVETPLMVLGSLFPRSNMPVGLEPCQYQSPEITGTGGSKDEHENVIISVPGLSLDSLPDNRRNLSFVSLVGNGASSTPVSFASEQERMAKTPVYMTLRGLY
jgi:hypothetical protein